MVNSFTGSQETAVAASTADKAGKYLGFEPRIKLEDGLRDLIK